MQHTHTHPVRKQQWQSCGRHFVGVPTWSNMQIIAKWKCVCKVKRSATRKVSQTTIFYGVAFVFVFGFKQLAGRGPSSCTWGRGWCHQFICATHANANKLNCKSWLAGSQLANTPPKSPTPKRQLDKTKAKWGIWKGMGVSAAMRVLQYNHICIYRYAGKTCYRELVGFHLDFCFKFNASEKLLLQQFPRALKVTDTL